MTGSVNVFGCRPMPNRSACTTGPVFETSGEGTRGERGTDALSAYGDFSSFGAKRGAALGCKKPSVGLGAARLRLGRRRTDGEARTIEVKNGADFVLSSKRRRCQPLNGGSNLPSMRWRPSWIGRPCPPACGRRRSLMGFWFIGEVLVLRVGVSNLSILKTGRLLMLPV